MFRQDRRNIGSLGKIETIALSLAVGGGIGNLIDRIAFGSVTDFLNFGIGQVRTGIFNVADMAIMAGLFLFLYAAMKPKPNPTPTP